MLDFTDNKWKMWAIAALIPNINDNYIRINLIWIALRFIGFAFPLHIRISTSTGAEKPVFKT